ncbi:MAG: hypothetical protein JSW08_03265 [archaeon]|nr:MAG: hypothetical protein JSW08_03265 [archaeon]
MFGLPKVFPQSKELKQIIESHGWTTYRIPHGERPIWYQIERENPAETFEVGDHSYFFVPIPNQRQTWRDAYGITKSLGPSLEVDPTYEGLLAVYHGSPKAGRANEVLFTRMILHEGNQTALFSPKIPQYPDPSKALLRTDLLLPIFEDHFRIITMEDLKREPKIAVVIVDDRHETN